MESLYSAHFRFYGSLNDFLRPSFRNQTLVFQFNGSPSLKDSVESIGPPHPEVAALFVDGEPARFESTLVPDTRVAVYPRFHSELFEGIASLQSPFPEPLSFVVDVNLGALAKTLRMLGFDTLYRNDYTDSQVADISASESRIALTRDRDLLKRSIVRFGYWIRNTDPIRQAREVVETFGLRDKSFPLTRCLECNGLILPLSLFGVPNRVRFQDIDEFYQCTQCGKIYWKGTHYFNMQSFVDRILTGK